MSIASLRAPMAYLVVEQPLREVLRLLTLARDREGTTSITLARWTSPQASLLDLEGLGRDIWQGVDGDRYLTELRDEWGA